MPAPSCPEPWIRAARRAWKTIPGESGSMYGFDDPSGVDPCAATVPGVRTASGVALPDSGRNRRWPELACFLHTTQHEPACR